MNYLEEKIFDVLKNAVTLMEGQDYVGAEKKLDIYYQAKKFIEDKSTLADSIADGLRKVRAHNILADEAASDDAKVLAKVIALMPTGTTIAIPQPVASTQRPTQPPHRQSTQASPQGQVPPTTTQPATQTPPQGQVPPTTTQPATTQPATQTPPQGQVPPTTPATPATPTAPATPATQSPSQGPVTTTTPATPATPTFSGTTVPPTQPVQPKGLLTTIKKVAKNIIG